MLTAAEHRAKLVSMHPLLQARIKEAQDSAVKRGDLSFKVTAASQTESRSLAQLGQAAGYRVAARIDSDDFSDYVIFNGESATTTCGVM